MKLPNLKKRYWVFELSLYAPAGGLEDIRYVTDDLNKAKENVDCSCDDSYVFDSVERKIV